MDGATFTHKKGEYDKAIADFTEGIRLDPKNAAAYHFRGRAYSKKSEKAKAEADFAQAKKLAVQGEVDLRSGRGKSTSILHVNGG